MRSGRPSLDALEAEIRETRRRLGALMARAEREFPLRPGLNLLRRFGGEGAMAESAGWWGLAAAAVAFAIGLVAAQRLGREPAPPAPGGPSTES